MKTTKITLEAYSEKSEKDWYGDFTYLDNPLSKYVDCKKFAECIIYPSSSGHGMGTEKILVHTTKEFLNIMGWEDDLKYIKNN